MFKRFETNLSVMDSNGKLVSFFIAGESLDDAIENAITTSNILDLAFAKQHDCWNDGYGLTAVGEPRIEWDNNIYWGSMPSYQGAWTVTVSARTKKGFNCVLNFRVYATESKQEFPTGDEKLKFTAEISELIEKTGIDDFCKKFDIPMTTARDWRSGRRRPPEYVVSMIRKLI